MNTIKYKIILFWSLIVFLFYSSCFSETDKTKKRNYYVPQDTLPSFPLWKLQATEMVKTQIIARDVKDTKVIQALINTPRHLFVPPPYRQYSYTDSPLPIDNGQTISQPYIVALMTELLQLQGNEKVLEIGTGSGYQAAILSVLAKEVYTIEIYPFLAEKSRKLLDSMQYKNITVRQGDGYKGWREHAPFDRIIVTAAPEEVPSELILQLKEGGRMVIPVGEYYQELLLIKKKDGKISKESIIPVRFVPMIHEEKK